MLDVDGVLAPFGCHEGPPQGYDFIEMNGLVDGMTLLFSESHPETMLNLMQVCDLMWATAWEDRANEHLLEHLGLEDPLPCIYFDHRLENEGKAPEVVGASRKLSGLLIEPGTETWKLPWIKQWAEMNEDRPFVWVDDEIRNDALVWAKERTEQGVPTLMIATDPSIGLTEEHVSQIKDWVDDQRDDL